MPKILYSRRMDRSTILSINRMKRFVKKTDKEEWTLSKCIEEAIALWMKAKQNANDQK